MTKPLPKPNYEACFIPIPNLNDFERYETLAKHLIEKYSELSCSLPDREPIQSPEFMKYYPNWPLIGFPTWLSQKPIPNFLAFELFEAHRQYEHDKRGEQIVLDNKSYNDYYIKLIKRAQDLNEALEKMSDTMFYEITEQPEFKKSSRYWAEELIEETEKLYKAASAAFDKHQHKYELLKKRSSSRKSKEKLNVLDYFIGNIGKVWQRATATDKFLSYSNESYGGIGSDPRNFIHFLSEVSSSLDVEDASDAAWIGKVQRAKPLLTALKTTSD